MYAIQREKGIYPWARTHTTEREASMIGIIRKILYHSVAIAILETLKRLSPAQQAIISTPLECVTRHLDEWEQHDWSAHSYALTLREMYRYKMLRPMVQWATTSTDRLAEWDERFMAQMILNMKRAARIQTYVYPTAADLRKTDGGLILHTADQTRAYEGAPGNVAKKMIDSKRWRELQSYERTQEYVGANAHPYTWTELRLKPYFSAIWKARINMLPFGTVLQDMDPLQQMCHVDGQPETREHVFQECEEYQQHRDNCAFPYGSNVALKYLLGFVDENGMGNYGDELLEDRKMRATAYMHTSNEIWKGRCASRQAFERQNNIGRMMRNNEDEEDEEDEEEEQEEEEEEEEDNQNNNEED
jgi:hypothetical protein